MVWESSLGVQDPWVCKSSSLVPRQPGSFLENGEGWWWVAESPLTGASKKLRQGSEMGMCSCIFQLSPSLWHKHGQASHLRSCMQRDSCCLCSPSLPSSLTSFLSRKAELKQAGFQLSLNSHRVLVLPVLGVSGVTEFLDVVSFVSVPAWRDVPECRSSHNLALEQ